MKSPFPGMDPFLELPAFWSDFHPTFINYWREAIAEALPPQYEATLGERVYLVEQVPDARRLGFPDVAVTHDNLPSDQAPGSAGGTATLTPVTVTLPLLEGPREAYIEILHEPELRLVATLELLSPANKELPGRTQFLLKRTALLYQNVHLIELDLLMKGTRLPVEGRLPGADYYYFLSRADQRLDCQLYHWTLRQPLPVLPIPLLSPDADILIDLGAVFTTAYERGRFHRRIKYGGPIPGFLSKADRQWAEELLRRGT